MKKTENFGDSRPAVLKLSWFMMRRQEFEARFIYAKKYIKDKKRFIEISLTTGIQIMNYGDSYVKDPDFDKDWDQLLNFFDAQV